MFSPSALVFLIAGTLIGMFVGLVPGLGAVVILSLLIPLTIGWNQTDAFVFLTAVIGGGNFAGSITAILINTPGTAPNAATLIDGYPLAKKGRAGEAIGASAAASALGAIVGVVILAASIPIMQEIVLLFGAPEIFLLGFWGVLIIATLIQGDTVAGLVSGIVGFLLAFHGFNIVTGTSRWAYGTTYFRGGFPLLPLIIGLFGLAEALKLIIDDETISDQAWTRDLESGNWTGVKSVVVHWRSLIRSAFIGTVVGAIPGIGSMVATFFAYSQEKLRNGDSGTFGDGDIRGVIAPEAANDAKDGGGFIPTLALGVPGSTVMAIIFGAFVLHGIPPGPLLIENHFDIVVVIIISLLLSNILCSAIGLLLTDELASITRLDIHYIVPVIVVFSSYGAFLSNGLFLNLVLAIVFGLLGYVMMEIDISRIPLLLAFILAPILEKNFFRSLQFSDGSYAIFASTPLTLVILLLIVLTVVYGIIYGDPDMEYADRQTASGRPPARRIAKYALYAGLLLWEVVLFTRMQGWGSTDRLLPLTAITASALLVGFDVIGDVFRLQTSTTIARDELLELASIIDGIDIKNLIPVFWILVFPISTYMIGFIMSTFVYICLYSYYHQGRVRTAIAYASLLTISLAATNIFLKANLWTGLLFE